MRIKKKVKSEKGLELYFFLRGVLILGDFLMRKKFNY